jgi:ATP-dependent helicase/nuclease subunit A
MMIENGFEENLDIEGTEFNAVRVMNTQKSKGLEAPVVILCAPCSGGIHAPSFYTECVSDEDLRDCYFGYAKVNKNPDYGFVHQFYEPAGWVTVVDKAKKKEELERERLLYVAATRAKNLLIISESAARDNPWNKLIAWLPTGAANILDNVYSEEADTVVVEVKKPADETKIAKTLDDIKTMRDEAFNNNKPTFGMFTPSEQVKKIRIDSFEDISHELEKTIRENTMEVIINGDEAQIRADRLEIGTIVHKLLETLIKNESALPDTIDALLESDRDDYITRAFLEGIIENFKERKLYDRIRKSDAVYTEVPFSFKVLAGGSFAGNTFTQDTYVNGIIDLVFKEDGKWIIMDYKTYSETEASHDLRKLYEPQLSAYKDVWESLTGEAVGEAEIFFIMKRLAG